MNTFFPFLYEPKKKKEPELIPLQIELDTPEYIPSKKEEKNDERGVFTIELFKL